MRSGDVKNLRTHVEFSRSSNGEWKMSIEDIDSGLMIAETVMDDENFSKLMSNRTAYGNMTHYDNPNIGKILETVQYAVPLDVLEGIFESYNKNQIERDMKSIFDYAEEKNPGFIAGRSSHNDHNYNRKKNTYSVLLRRWVPRKKG